MAYDQGYYQPPARPYNGRAAQRPGPPQEYGQAPPLQQQYPPQTYDQYAQDGYGYGGYENGYADDYGGNGGYQDMHGGGRGNGGYQDMNGGGRGNGGYHDMNGGGRGNGYPPQNQDYPPQQEYYGDPRGGGGMPPPNQGRGGPTSAQRLPTADGFRGGYDQRGGGQGRGYANGAPPQGRGGRPAPLEHSGGSDPGSRPPAPRKPLKTPPKSPDVPAWDNPFPTFPGAKKKTSLSEEQKIVQQMANMDVGGLSQNRPRTAGAKDNQDRYGGRGAPTDDYGRPSVDSQRSIPRDFPPRGPSRGPPQQGYPDQRQGPTPPGQGYNAPQNGYGDPRFTDRGAYGAAAPPMRDDFGPPARSMTLPNEAPAMPNGRLPPKPMGGAPDERPYNGPIGRAMPPRPATATGTRPPPQRNYPAPEAVKPPQQHLPTGPYTISQQQKAPSHQPEESISDFYDHYYEAPNSAAPRPGRSQSNESEMPNFDAMPVQPTGHRRGASIDNHIQPGPGARGNPFDQQNGYPQGKPMQSQPDMRARAQPQAAVFEMASEPPPMPNAYPPQSYPDDGYALPSGQYNDQQHQRGPQPVPGYGEFNQPPAQGQYPPRSTSATPRANGLPDGPRAGFNGAPGGPSPQNGQPRPSPPSDALPSHPPPVRAGLIPNSVAAQANNKPTPVRNYNNVSLAQQQQQQPQQQQPTPQARTAAQQAPAGPPAVTAQELEHLRNATKTNPNDQASAMMLARKLVEACDVLVPGIPDQRTRGKTREKYIMDAHKILKKLVAAQNTDAMFYLADCYGRGALGLEADNKEAFLLYQSAAKAGHAAAAYRTAVCCELGNEEGGGTRKDPLKAIQWYKRAAMLGDTPAMYKMGMILLKGLLGQPRNPREAVGWLKRAAERADAENPHALHELGLLYEMPQGPDGSILRDETYSFSLFQQAADLGYKFSQFRMGCAFEYGLFNCPIDPRQSIMWYSRAAVQEEHQSELALSGWYLTGSEGVLQQSDTEAYLWARKAAMAGLAKAEYAMGYFTEVGIGSPASLEDAKRWYWRAAAQNFPKARERLEDLKKGGSKAGLKSRERISRSKVGRQNEGECAVM